MRSTVTLAAVSLAALALGGCGGSEPKPSAACQAAAAVSRYILKGTGLRGLPDGQSIQNDAFANDNLTRAQWQTSAERRDSARLAYLLDPVRAGPAEAGAIVSASAALMTDCKNAAR